MHTMYFARLAFGQLGLSTLLNGPFLGLKFYRDISFVSKNGLMGVRPT